MYQVPGKVLHAPKPGLFGVNMIQLIAGVGGFYAASSLFDNLPISVVGVLIGLALGWRTRGMYVGQMLFYRVWGMVAVIVSPEDTLIDPAIYYQTPPSREGRTYIVTQPDGQTYTLKT